MPSPCGWWQAAQIPLYKVLPMSNRACCSGVSGATTGSAFAPGFPGQVINAGRVSPQMMQQWLPKSGVILRGGGCDEAPHCYRRLTDVLEAQGNTIEVLETLSPVIVVMAGENEFDPFKD